MHPSATAIALTLLATLTACDRTQPTSTSSPAPTSIPAATSAPAPIPDTLYFSRTARYDRHGDSLVAIDPTSPRVITMDPWPELIFTMADGEHTIAQLRTQLASTYPKGPPPGLDDQITDLLHQLQSEHLIRLHPDKSPLPFYLAKPIADQNPEEARKAMTHDGFGNLHEETRQPPSPAH